MKRVYLKPAVQVVKLQHLGIICTSEPVSRTAGNADLNYEGGSNGPARARQNGVWDEEEEE